MAQPAETFPFGLDKLKWNMRYADVKAQLSPSIPEMKAPIGAPTTNQREYFWGPLPWKDCMLEVWTFFADDRLDYIDVKPRTGLVSDSCKTAMQDELVAHYGETARNEVVNPINHKSSGISMIWKMPATMAIYGNARLTLQEAGAPELTFYDSVGSPVSK